MKKHEDALKTIGEVSYSIEVPVYVIRFWETKFKDLKPIKKKKVRDIILKLKLIF